MPRVAAAVVVGLAVGFGVIWVFESTTDFLLMMLVAVFLAFAMLPAVDSLTKRGWRRGAATGVVMGAGAVLIAIFALAMFSLLIGQINQLVDRLPDYVDTVTVWLNDSLSIEVDTAQLKEEFGRLGFNRRQVWRRHLGWRPRFHLVDLGHRLSGIHRCDVSVLYLGGRAEAAWCHHAVAATRAAADC